MSHISRRTLVTTGASLLATSASLLMLREVEAATHDVVHHPMPPSNALPPPALHHASGNASASDRHSMSEEMRRCIQLCHDCHAVCLHVIGHCVELGGRHAAPDHIRLLMDCAQICATTADYMARGSSLHARMCSFCSEICRRCAERCEQLRGEDPVVTQCAELCQRCAESCEQMASHGAA